MAVVLVIVGTAAAVTLAIAAYDRLVEVKGRARDIRDAFLDSQFEGHFLPGAYRWRTNVLDSSVVVPRIPGGGDKALPSTIAQVYAKATAEATKAYQDAALSTSDRVITVPYVSRPPPLLTGANPFVMGSLASYPYAHYDNMDNKDPIETRIVGTDPFPSTMPGPSYDRFPLATVPDGIRSIWGLEGLAARDARQSRQSSINTRPMFSSGKRTPPNFPPAPRPYDRIIQQ